MKKMAYRFITKYIYQRYTISIIFVCTSFQIFSEDYNLPLLSQNFLQQASLSVFLYYVWSSLVIISSIMMQLDILFFRHLIHSSFRRKNHSVVPCIGRLGLSFSRKSISTFRRRKNNVVSNIRKLRFIQFVINIEIAYTSRDK